MSTPTPPPGPYICEAGTILLIFEDLKLCRRALVRKDPAAALRALESAVARAERGDFLEAACQGDCLAGDVLLILAQTAQLIGLYARAEEVLGGTGALVH
jgi:hypothetical protein